jgi:hypothetical protein
VSILSEFALRPSFSEVGNFKSDPSADLAVTNFDSNTVVLKGNGDGAFGSNGGALKDLVIANYGADNVSILVNHNGCPGGV